MMPQKKVAFFSLTACAVCILIWICFRPMDYRVIITNQKPATITKVKVVLSETIYQLGSIKPGSSAVLRLENVGEECPYIEFKDDKGVVRQTHVGAYRAVQGFGLIHTFIDRDETVSFIDYSDSSKRYREYAWPRSSLGNLWD